MASLLTRRRGTEMATPVLENGRARAVATHDSSAGRTERGWSLQLDDPRVLAAPEHFEFHAPLRIEEVNDAEVNEGR
jgi:hypothetical protein